MAIAQSKFSFTKAMHLHGRPLDPNDVILKIRVNAPGTGTSVVSSRWGALSYVNDVTEFYIVETELPIISKLHWVVTSIISRHELSESKRDLAKLDGFTRSSRRIISVGDSIPVKVSAKPKFSMSDLAGSEVLSEMKGKVREINSGAVVVLLEDYVKSMKQACFDSEGKLLQIELVSLDIDANPIAVRRVALMTTDNNGYSIDPWKTAT